MDLLEDIDDPSLPLVQASNALGVSRATLYRRTKPPTPPTVSVRAPNPRRLDESERKAVLDVLHSEQFVVLAIRSERGEVTRQRDHRKARRPMTS